MKKIILTILTCSVFVGCMVPRRSSEQFTLDQRLIVSAFCLEQDEVCRLLALGANVNARYGKGDKSVFMDKWELGGAPMGSSNWTPLLAVLNSQTYPEPTRETANTTEALAKAREVMQRFPERVVRERDSRRLQITRILLDAGADINADDGYGATPLYTAVDRRYEEIAFLLLDRNPKVNTTTGIYIDSPGNYTPLHRAVYNPRLLKALIERGADVNAQASWGVTPYALALTEGYTDAVSILLSAGVAMPKEGPAATSLFVMAVFSASKSEACLAASLETFRLLIAAGADPNGKHAAFYGDTTLHLAISQIDEPAPFVKMLVGAGANVNERNDEGLAPLHFAAMYGTLETVKLLVNAGADLSAKNGEGKTAFHLVSWSLNEPEIKDMPDSERQQIMAYRAMANLLMRSEQGKTGTNTVPVDANRKVADPQP
jgi:ankyrin repeat protein